MNVYDKAHDLARALKETPEYKTYVAAKERVNQNPEISAMINDLTEKNMKLQPLIMAGAASQEDVAQLQSLSMVVMANPLAAEYLQAQMILSKIVGDIYGILGEVVA